MFPMTVTVHNQTQLNAVAIALMGESVTDTPNRPPVSIDVPTGPAIVASSEKAEKAPVKETAAKKPATVQKTQAESAPTQPTASAEAAAVPESKPESTSAPETAAAPLAYPDVVAAINKLATAKGREAAVALLGEFGVSKGPELKPEQFAEFIEQATAATGV